MKAEYIRKTSDLPEVTSELYHGKSCRLRSRIEFTNSNGVGHRYQW